MEALQKIRQSGFDIALVDGYIEISPSSKLTDTQRDYIKAHKAEIIAELTAANDKGITEAERAHLTEWLAHIGENDPEMIAEFWRNIEHKPGAKEYFLQRAYAEAAPDHRRHCHQCQHHRPVPGKIQIINCVARGLRLLDDIPRHCGSYEPKGH